MTEANGEKDTRQNGAIVEQLPCGPMTIGTYEQYVEWLKGRYVLEAEAAKQQGFQLALLRDVIARLPSIEEFEFRTAYKGFECVRISYLSDGLKVIGYIWKPRDTASPKKLPLIIFNRGGNRDFGKVKPWYRFGFHHFLLHGFVVIASQYRGNDGGEGCEEFGGADVRDVLNLWPLAEKLGYVDMNNVFMLGESRGAMMTYLTLKNDMAVKAAAVVGGLADLFANGKERPEMLEHVYRQLIPDFDRNPEERMRERSAVFWPEKINVPLLIMHGGADWRSNPDAQALGFARKLQVCHKPYELVVYAEDDHGLSLNCADSERRIVEWFKRYAT